MSALVFGIPAVLFCGFLFFVFFRSDFPPERTRLIVAVLVLLPFASACGLLFFGSHGSRTYYSDLVGFSYGLRELSLGGDLKSDDIHVPGLPSAAFTVRAAGDALEISPGKGYTRRQIVRTDGGFLGLVPLKDKSLVGIAPFKDNGSAPVREYFFRRRTVSCYLTDKAGASKTKLPPRQAKIPFTNWKKELYDYVGYAGKSHLLDENGLAADGSPPEDAAATVIFKWSPDDTPGLIPLREGVSVDGAEAWPYPAKIKAGSSLKFYTLEGSGNKLKLRAEFSSIKLQGDSVEIYLKNPRRVMLRIPASQKEPLIALTADPDLFSGENVVYYSNLPKPSFANSQVYLAPSPDGFKATGYSGVGSCKRGEILSFGEKDNLLVRVSGVSGLWTSILWLAATGVSVLLLGWRLCDKFRFAALFGAVSLITTYRVVMAFSAQNLYPFSREALPLAIYFLALAPAVVFFGNAAARLMCQEGGSIGNNLKLRGVPEGLCGLAFAALACVNLSALGWGKIFAGLIPVAVMALILFLLAYRLSRKVISVENLLNNWFDGGGSRWMTYRSVLVAALIIMVCRLGLFMIGVKEQIPFIMRFPLSVVLVPLWVAMVCWCATVFVRTISGVSPQMQWKQPIFFVGLFGFCAVCFMVPAWAVSDIGEYVYVIPATVFSAGVGVWAFKQRFIRDRWVMLTTFVPLALLLLGLLFPIKVLHFVEVAKGSKLSFVAKLEDPKFQVWESNYLRALQYISPKTLQEIGNRGSEMVAQRMWEMDQYTTGGFFGTGYMDVEVSDAFASTCTSDNVAAVYLIGQFGILGALGAVLSYLLFMLAGYRSDTEVAALTQSEFFLPHFLAEMSALTLFLVSLYMLLANCNAMPFTGRNMYFLSLESMGDIWEGSILLAMTVIGAAWGNFKEE